MKQAWLVGTLLLTLAVLVAAVLVIVQQGYRHAAQPAMPASAPAVPHAIVVSGRIEGRTLSVTAPAQAVVGALHVSAGQAVSQGETLLLLVDSVLNERVRIARERRDTLAESLAAADELLDELRTDIPQQLQAAEQKSASMRQQVAERRERFEQASRIAKRLEKAAKSNLAASQVAEPAKLRAIIAEKAETDLLTAQLKAARYRIFLLDAELELARAEHELALAEASKQKIEAMAADVRSKHMQARQAEDVLQDKEAELAALTIRSPAAGTLMSIDVGPGQQVTQGTGLLTLALADDLIFMARVATADAASIEPGTEARIRIDAWPDRQFRARIAEISRRVVTIGEDPLAGQEPVSTIKLVILDNPEGLLKPGMAAHTILNQSDAE